MSESINFFRRNGTFALLVRWNGIRRNGFKSLSRGYFLIPCGAQHMSFNSRSILITTCFQKLCIPSISYHTFCNVELDDKFLHEICYYNAHNYYINLCTKRWPKVSQHRTHKKTFVLLYYLERQVRFCQICGNFLSFPLHVQREFGGKQCIWFQWVHSLQAEIFPL